MKVVRGKPNTENERRDTPKGATLDFHPSVIEAAHCFIATEYAALQRFQYIHEMACGDGALVLPLRNAGFRVFASDIVDRGCPGSHIQDFLDAANPVAPLGLRRRIAGFTNPPFFCAEQFIVRACEQYDYVAMILRLRFLAAKHLVDERGRTQIDGKRISNGKPIWQTTRIPFARVIKPKSRWKTMHRDGYAGKKNDSSTIDFAIFVWEADHRGPALIIEEPDYRYITAYQKEGVSTA